MHSDTILVSQRHMSLMVYMFYLSQKHNEIGFLNMYLKSYVVFSWQLLQREVCCKRAKEVATRKDLEKLNPHSV